MEADKTQDSAQAPPSDAGTKELKQGIETTRADMTAALTALEQKLNPADLREKAAVELHIVEEKVKEAVKEQLHEAKTLLRQELTDAKESVKEELHTAYVSAKQSMRDATFGRVENMATQIGDVMNDTRDSLFQTVRNNPIPAALTGVGIAWLLMNRSNAAAHRSRGGSFDRGRVRGGYDRDASASGAAGGVLSSAQHAAGQVVDHVGSAIGSAENAIGGLAHRASDAASSAVHMGMEAAGHLASQTSNAAGEAIRQVGDTAGHLADQAHAVAGHVAEQGRAGARRVEHVLGDTLHERPLVLGAVALAMGAAVGLSLPRTHREDALVGEVRDQLLHKAQEVTGDAAQAVQDLTVKAAGTAKTAIQDAIKTS
jgi:hypothetical protein